MNFLIAVITNIPIWVFGLFSLLLWIGWRSSRDREASVVFYYALPFLGLLSVNQLLKTPHLAFAGTAFVLGNLAGAYFGYRLQKRWIRGWEGQRILLAGEWFTMAAVMTIFWANFADGFVREVAPGLAAEIGFVTLITLCVSSASGSFLGRSLRVIVDRS